MEVDLLQNILSLFIGGLWYLAEVTGDKLLQIPSLPQVIHTCHTRDTL